MIERFERQFNEHGKLKELAMPSKFVQALIKRSSFNQVAVEQLVVGFQETKWRWSDDMEELLLERTVSLFSTQLIEDINDVQKQTTAAPKDSEGKPKRRDVSAFRKPQVMLHVCQGV